MYGTGSQLSFQHKLQVLENISDWDALEAVLVQWKPHIPKMDPNVFNFKLAHDRPDPLAVQYIPAAARKEDTWFPILTSADNSCFYHTLSRLTRGHEGDSDEMR